MTAAEYALSQISPGDRVGLGTGRASVAFVKLLGTAVQSGLRIVGVPTSESTADLARTLGIPLSNLADTPELDIAVDGADEVDPQLRLVKGWGGALLREKVVAAASKRFLVLVGPEKLVPYLGCRGKIPVEVVPFAAPFCHRRLAALGLAGTIRPRDGGPWVTDNGNWILDCAPTKGISDAKSLDVAIHAIPGVAGTGFFIDMADEVVVDEPTGARVMAKA
jgi:ribose 5-phosphate isomerase A